jgi:beta-phosphoglucomutase-like phosphatase (HAD superfamily)
VIDAVVFDLDGLLLDTEQVWDEVREQLTRERGGRWHERAQADMMGMSSPEWSRYMHEVIGLREPPEEINDEGGINGRKVAFKTEDDAYAPPKAVEMVRKLVEQDKVLLVFQPLGTPPNMAIRKYMNARSHFLG